MILLSAAWLALAAWAYADEVPAIFNVRFAQAVIPAAPDVSKKSPGPGGGADRAGYTTAILDKSVGISWGDAGRQGDKILVYAQSIDVDFSIKIAVAVSSVYDKQGCPYDETWKHELTHARAFKSIYAAGKDALLAEIGRARVPTKASPEAVKPKDVASYEAAVSRKLRRIVDRRARAMLEMMDEDRKEKDSGDSYAAVYDGCASAEWGFRP